jgi:hypothetical protein
MFAGVLLGIFAGGLVSCDKKAPPVPEEILAPAEEPLSVGSPVAILFGYGYNDEEFIGETKQLLVEHFAPATEDDGPAVDMDALVRGIVYPEDFYYGRISQLYDKIKDEPLGGFILLGSPENTHAVLARIQDNSNDAFPVISLFSQDDVLGTESGSDLVLDFVPLPEGPEGADDAEEQEASRKIAASTVVHLAAALHRLNARGEALQATPEGVVALVGPGFGVLPFRDAETALISANHFYLEVVP